MTTVINPDNSESDVPLDQDDIAVGPLRHPRNMMAVHAKTSGEATAGSIHDDATAQKLGFRGGTIAGSVHMGQFPPVLTHVFGDRWWQTGSMSLYFRFATIDNEPVRCFARRSPELASAGNAQTNIWVEDTRDHLVAEGTASVGEPDAESALRVRLRSIPRPEDLRILKSLSVGDTSRPTPTKASRPDPERLKYATEPLAAYTADPAIVSPSTAVQTMRAGERDVLPRDKNTGVGLFGAIELQYLNGPICADVDYMNTVTVLAVSETPKTEYFWYEARLRNKENDRDIASMLMMLRFMKASSQHWQ